MSKKTLITTFTLLSTVAGSTVFGVDVAPPHQDTPSTPPSAVVAEKPTPGLFVMAERGYSIQFPADWLRDKVMEGLDVFSYAPIKALDKPAFANASVISGKLGEGLNLDAFYSANIEKLPAVLKDFKKENEGQGGIPGLNSKWIMYSYKLGDVEVRVLQYFVISGDYGCVITFSATPEEFVSYRGVFDNIATTFQQIKEPAKVDAKADVKADVKTETKTEK